VQIKKIHLAAKSLNIKDSDYRSILTGFNNADGNPCLSCKELSENQANILLYLFKKKLGWQEKRSGKKLKYEEYNGRDTKFASAKQMRKIEAEWMQYSREKTESSMNKFIFRIIKVNTIEWVLKKDVNKLLKAIESLTNSPNTCSAKENVPDKKEE
jgi:hypothetical protein